MNDAFLKSAGSGTVATGGAQKSFRAGLRALDEAAANVAEAGRLFASIPPADWDALVGDAPAPMRRTLGYVRAVGEGRMIPEIATGAGEAMARLRGLPLDEQRRLWAESVEMFDPERTGKHAKYMRYVTDMDGDEVKRAFEKTGDGWRLRTFDEQKAWVASQAGSKTPAPPHGVDRPGRWSVRSGRVYLAKAKVDAGLTKRDVEAILKDLGEEA